MPNAMDRSNVCIHVVYMGCPGSKFDDTYNNEISNLVDKSTFDSVLYKVNSAPEVRKYLEEGEPLDWGMCCFCMGCILCPLCTCSPFPSGGPLDSICWSRTKSCVTTFWWQTAQDLCCSWKDVSYNKFEASLNALLKEANENPSFTCIWSYDRLDNSIKLCRADSYTN